jgi:hypothetical protein
MNIDPDARKFKTLYMEELKLKDSSKDPLESI